MLKESKGSIVNISSKVAFTRQGKTSGYAAAKGAQLALTRERAAELLPYGIHVNAAVPTEVMTPLYRRWLETLDDPDEELRHTEARIPLGHRMTTLQEDGRRDCISLLTHAVVPYNRPADRRGWRRYASAPCIGAGSSCTLKAAMKRVTRTTNYSTPALEKGLNVLELLAHQPAGLTKSQIARELDRTVSEIFRMLICLEHRGYISHVQGDQYALTLKLFKMVQEHPPTERLIAEATPVMHRFTQRTLQSCHLGVIEDGRVVILAQVNAPSSTGFYVKLGSSVDIMDASTGYVILAHQDDAQREASIAEWKRVTGKTVPADLKGHLTRIRRKGFEERASYQVKGVVNITFPIFDDHGSAIGAITVPHIEHLDAQMARSAVVAALRQSAEEITAAIGGHQRS